MRGRFRKDLRLVLYAEVRSRAARYASAQYNEARMHSFRDGFQGIPRPGSTGRLTGETMTASKVKAIEWGLRRWWPQR
jgi:hypothetical protein